MMTNHFMQLIAFMFVGTLAAATGTAELAFAKDANDSTSDNTNNVSLTCGTGLDLSYDHKVADQWTAGIYAGSPGRDTGPNGTEESASIYGLQVHWTPLSRALSDGPYLEPYLGYMRAKFTSSETGYSTTGQGLSGGLMIGYAWFWDSGLNLALGVGINDTILTTGSMTYSAPNGTVSKLEPGPFYSNGMLEPAEIALGYAF